MRMDCFLDLFADSFAVVEGFLLMEEKGQSIDWITHQMYHHLHNVSLLKLCRFILERSITMSKRFKLVNKVSDYLSKGHLVL